MSAADRNAVQVQGLEKRFGAFTAVDRISFSVRTGEVFGFLGPNGAGKSTTIRMLCGIIAPTAGRGFVGGADIVSGQKEIKQNIGYMSQKFSLYGDLTVEENIDFYAGVYGLEPARLRERKEWVLGLAGLGGQRGTLASALAGGWKQRLALGCAIIHEPPVVFLDEPTSGVDPIARREFWKIIRGMAGRGVTVFVTTHYMDEAEYCDRLALIYRGRIVALGTPRQLKTEAMTEEVWRAAGPGAEEKLPELKKQDWVRGAALFGTALHVVLAPERDARRRLTEFFSGTGFEVGRIEPSLEDVFVTLIERCDRQREDGNESGAR